MWEPGDRGAILLFHKQENRPAAPERFWADVVIGPYEGGGVVFWRSGPLIRPLHGHLPPQGEDYGRSRD